MARAEKSAPGGGFADGADQFLRSRFLEDVSDGPGGRLSTTYASLECMDKTTIRVRGDSGRLAGPLPNRRGPASSGPEPAHWDAAVPRAAAFRCRRPLRPPHGNPALSAAGRTSLAGRLVIVSHHERYRHHVLLRPRLPAIRRSSTSLRPAVTMVQWPPRNAARCLIPDRPQLTAPATPAGRRSPRLRP